MEGSDVLAARVVEMLKAGEVVENIGRDLKLFGGHLECSTCGTYAPLGDIAFKLANGWPRCCGYTMTWVTRAQELERIA